MTPAQCRKNRVARRLVASGRIEASAHLGAPKRRVRISLFGDLSLHLADREIELRSRKARALVAYLALAPDMRESRDRLAGLLWSETDNDKARTSLRQTLHVVRKALYEAVDIDGGTTRHKLRHVTIPMITPIILFNLVLSLIHALQTFTQAYVMTQGGPNNATLFYVFYLYRTAFADGQMGYAAALAWVLFVIIVALTALVFRSSSRWVYYEGER